MSVGKFPNEILLLGNSVNKLHLQMSSSITGVMPMKKILATVIMYYVLGKQTAWNLRRSRPVVLYNTSATEQMEVFGQSICVNSVKL